jgi:hypothetical protein
MKATPVKNGNESRGEKKPARIRRVFARLGWIVLGCTLILAGTLAAVSIWPSLGAQGADLLRGVIGDEAVARLEMEVYQVQDTLQKWKYDLGWATPSAPWGNTPFPEYVSTLTSTPLPSMAAAIPSTLVFTQEVTPVATATPVPVTWPPASLSPLGSLAGEGTWSEYIQDAAGQTVAYRTYLQPDPSRPYTVVAVIAFDLRHTRLHFVLGSVEPYSPDGPKRTGEMPAVDKVPGFLLAMFNGGFKARHGEFGAMADGLVALPAQDGLGTLVIYQGGGVRIGEWGTEITPTKDMLAWRQNGPLVIDHGIINTRIYSNLPQDWGYTVNDVSPTWRSGVGVSADQKTLYYFCGPSLSMEALAKAMQAAGADAAIQLDINNYWVHFVAVRTDGKKLILDPLFPYMMYENIDRYLWPYTRDYFYVTGLR